MRDLLNSYLGAYNEDFAYDFDNKIMLNWYPQRILSLTDKNSRVLELGVGHGYTCNHFADYYAEYSVVDGSPSVIKQFQQLYPNTKAQLISSYFEDFKSNELFDVIIMGFVLEHVDDPGVVLRRFKDILAPDGRCFVAVPNGECLHRRFGHKAGLLEDMMSLGEGDHALGHKRVYNLSSMTQLLESCGYQVIRREGIFLKALTTEQLQSLDLSEEILASMCEVGVDYPELSAGLLFEAVVE